jgi:hypothetical protein
MKVMLSSLFTLVIVALLAFVANADSGSPSSYKLLQQSDLVYAGAFRLPTGSLGTPSGIGFGYGDHPITYNYANNSLYISGYDALTAEVTIPQPVTGSNLNNLNRAILLHTFADAFEGKRMNVDPSETNGIRVGGHLFYNNMLYLTSFAWYDGDMSQSKSHFVRPPNLNTTGQVSGPYTVGTLNAGFYSGYMGLIPVEWQSSLGGVALTGNCCLSIINRTSFGPAAFAFNPTDIGKVNPVPVTPLVYYPAEHQTLGDWASSPDPPNLYFNNTSEVKGIVFPSQTRSVLFFGRQGTGKACYGTGGVQGDCYDPATSDHGTHAYPYVYYAWAYDANDLLAVKNGQRQPWDVRPYALWTFNFPFANSDAHIQGAAYDPQTQRIFLTQCWGDEASPLIYIFNVNASIVSQAPAPSNLRIGQ